MRVLGLIPARGGSKGVARKNVRLLAGRPLLQYTVETARASRALSRIVLTTEDEEIANEGRRLGAEVPFMRPPSLAADTTPMLPVVQHAVRFLEAQGESCDAVCLLQPTHPFRRAADIDGCIALLERTDVDSVMTILRVPTEYNPHWTYFRSDDGTLRLSTGEASPVPRRQDLQPAFHREGSVYLTRRDVIVEGNSLYGMRVAGFEVSAAGRVNLDTEEDWLKAERMLAAGTY